MSTEHEVRQDRAFLRDEVDCEDVVDALLLEAARFVRSEITDTESNVWLAIDAAIKKAEAE